MADAQISDADTIDIDLETEADAGAVARLVDAAFGPGRWAKTAERLREHNRPIAGLSLVAREDGRLIGSVRLWPVLIGDTAAAFLGPIAVENAQRRHGVGARLVAHACVEAEAQGLAAILLVGDVPYFGRFGFVPSKARLPGPVDPRRVLIRVFGDQAPPEGNVRRP